MTVRYYSPEEEEIKQLRAAPRAEKHNFTRTWSMTMGKASVTSTKTKADFEKVQEILSRYQLECIDFVFDKNGYLHAIGEKGNEEVLPRAVLVVDLPKREDFEDEQEYWDSMWYVFSDEGEKGFIALLRELATCIETPMTILSAGIGGNHSASAYMWSIEPGSAEVQTLDAYEGPGDDSVYATDEESKTALV